MGLNKKIGITASALAFTGCMQQDYGLLKAPPSPTPKCTQAAPVIGDVNPSEIWHWAGWSSGTSSYRITYSSPVAGDILGDGKVKIVVIPSTSNYTSINGPIVVLDGATGKVEWNSMDQSSPFGLNVSSTPALIDLDGDGIAEIVGVSFLDGGGQAISIIDYKTRAVRLKYSTGFTCGSYCSVAVGDIDGDGKAEIVAGNTVLNSDGTLKFRLPNSVMIPTIAKLIPSKPGLQIIVGSNVFSNKGELIWAAQGADVCTGYAFTAVGDLANDKSPKLICSGGGYTNVYEFNSAGQGSLAWKKPIPRPDGVTGGSNNGGAPNVGHFLGNSELQFGLAGGDFYLVYDARGKEIWRQATYDHSSSSTGSTLFDLNGDGKVEVLYNDEKKLRIYNGSDGQVLWSTDNPSGTLWEYPLILDVNGDKSADIVICSPTLGGVRMFSDPAKKWVNTRSLWNQYSYIPQLVSDKLGPIAAPALPDEGFRVNPKGTLPSGELVCQ